MVRTDAIPATAGASNSQLPPDRATVLSVQEAGACGLRVFPATIAFDDTQPGSTYQRRFGVQNLRRSSVKVIFPNVTHTTKDHYLCYPHYHLKLGGDGKTISDVGPGLEKVATLVYTCTDSEAKHDFAKIQIGEDFTIRIPIICTPIRPILVAPGEVCFGELPSDGTPIARRVTLLNRGRVAGCWEVQYGGATRVTFEPERVVIGPGQKRAVTVELIPEIEGPINETASFVSEDVEPTPITLSGLVTRSALEMLEPGRRGPLRLVDFGAVYYGTRHQRLVVLRNAGVRPVCYTVSWSPHQHGQELGVDLTGCHLAPVEESATEEVTVRGTCDPPEHCFRVDPAFGQIPAKGELMLSVEFTPRAYPPEKAFKSAYQAPPRRDYCLFLTIQPSIADMEHNLDFGKVYLGMRATSLPLLFNFRPVRSHFPETHPGQRIMMNCKIANQSTVLPLRFSFSNIAHFRASCKKGTLDAEETRDVGILCKPTQIGPLSRHLLLDLLGTDSWVEGEAGLRRTEPRLLASARIRVATYCAPITPELKPLFIPGITPLWGHEEACVHGERVRPPCDGVPVCTMAAVRSTKHRWVRWASLDLQQSCYLALPNDMARSIRPYQGQPVRSIFTGVPRYSYLDPTYQYTPDEWRHILLNEARYQEYIDGRRLERWVRTAEQMRRLYDGQEDDKLLNKTATQYLGDEFSRLLRLWSTVCSRERRRLFRLLVPAGPPVPGLQIVEDSFDSQGLEFVEKFDDRPKSHTMRVACERQLTCVEMSRVKIPNKLLDFGEVAQDVWACRTLDVLNPLETPVLFRLHVDCRELEHTAPTSAVVPARSAVRLPVIFHCGTKRQYKRVIKYSINGTCLDNVLILASVVRMRLDISTKRLHFKCANLTSISPGVYQMVVVLRNSLNGVGEYRWLEETPDADGAFSVRPARGVIEPYHSQRCVVTMRPSLRPRPPHGATFACHVAGGDPLALTVTSELGMPKVKLTSDRLQLDNMSIFQVKRFTPWLFNMSMVDAFFSVSDPQPYPGVNVTPLEGVVPAGGSVPLLITMVPLTLARFDFAVRVQIRDGQAVSLAFSGRSEAPEVVSDCGALYFGGVMCGGSASQAFHLENRSKVAATLVFDLREHAEFSLSGLLEPGRDGAVEEAEPGRYLVRLAGGQTVPLSCRFAPHSLANHGFVVAPLLHVPEEVRGLEGVVPPGQSPPPPAAQGVAATASRAAKPRARPSVGKTEPVVHLPALKVIATALKQPVVLEPATLRFTVGADLLERCFKVTKRATVRNSLSRAVRVVVNARSADCFRVGEAPEHGEPPGVIERLLGVGEQMRLPIVFVTSFLYPRRPTTVRAHLPVYVDTLDHPAVTLDIEAECTPTHMTAAPRTLYMPAVPLGTTANSSLKLLCHHYQQPDELKVSVSYVEVCPPGELPVITVRLPQSGRVQGGGRPEQAVPVRVSFVSPRPVSVSARLLARDGAGRTVTVPLLAGADNCLLTTYRFLCLHPEAFEDAPAAAPPAAWRDSPRPSDAAAPAVGDAGDGSGATIEEVTHSLSNAASEPADSERLPAYVTLESGTRAEIPRFPSGTGAFEAFFQTAYDAIERWFVNFGFPTGLFPYELHRHLPDCMSHAEASTQFTKEEKAQAQMWQTIGDSIAYLSNKKVPQSNADDEADLGDDTSAILSHIRRNRAILEFLKKEGALLTHVRPEFLLRFDDFQILLQVIQEIQETMGMSKADMAVRTTSLEAGMSAGNLKPKESSTSHSSAAASLQDVARHLLDPDVVPVYEAFRDEAAFRDLAKSAWMDVLLQTFLRFVVHAVARPVTVAAWPEATEEELERYVPHHAPHHATPPPPPVESGFYSAPERLMLAWMTWAYNAQLRRLWGEEPDAERRVANFDSDLSDGAVLCCLFAAHCPFLRDHLRAEVYPRPATPEQAFQNCVVVAESCAQLNLDSRLDPAAIMDAHPVVMLVLVTQLYEKLPLYWPREPVHFLPELGGSQTRQFNMRNPASRPVVYEVKMLGADRGVFQVQGGPEIVIGPRRTLEVTVQASVLRIKQYSATLLLCPKSCVAPRPRPIVYPLLAGPLGTSGPVVVEVASPLYTCRTVVVDIPYPLKDGGEFSVRLTDKPQGEQDLDTWLRGGVEPFPVIALPQPAALAARNAKGRSRLEVAHMPWAARGRDYYALFSNPALGDFTVCFRSAPTDPPPSAAVCPAHGWVCRMLELKPGIAVCTEPGTGAVPLARRAATVGDREMQVCCRDGPQPELEKILRQGGPPPDGIGAVWVVEVREVLCAHLHLVVDLSATLLRFLEQCAPAWESAEDRERRSVFGAQVSSEMIHQFQTMKYVNPPTKPQAASATKRAQTPEPPAPPAKHLAYQVISRNKEFLVSPKVVHIEGTAGQKSVPLCLSAAFLSDGWHTADILLRNQKFYDVIAARVAVLVWRPKSGDQKLRQPAFRAR